MTMADRRVLVTGGAGFLGSHVCDELRQRGCSEPAIPRSTDYDLRTSAGTREMLMRYRPDTVIHLAATVGGIGANRDNPGRYFYENAMMGLNLLEECRMYGVSKVVIVGTICAYPKFTPVPFKEEDLWGGYPEETNAPYGLAKKMMLVQSQAYRQQYGMNSVYLLPVNLYGPRDNFDLQTSHVIPAMIRKFEDARTKGAEEVVFWGDGSPTREFLHVRDAARGVVMATESYNEEDPVNLGSGQEIKIRDLANSLKNITGYEGEIRWDTSKPNGQPRRCLDVSRARERFGFQAEVAFEQGLVETLDWYRYSINSKTRSATTAVA
ncbi:GDP-L-fucose synthase family protein [Calycomorphotria hydatis]|uniref:GDP-L-fucose synthase n=1 Tax=Calycomorphotria hydatis TaxID=2528027 RepID=A0A517T7W7_9PLAN|nr:GDP-L-fucose synthase [Calycomorphotria hydatis]QDT64450.1 GDP-L-fucose synthase [Calycomorphotria hydatis]